MSIEEKTKELLNSTGIKKEYLSLIDEKTSSVFSLLSKYELIVSDNNNIKFTELGLWLFSPCSYNPIYYFDNVYLYIDGEEYHYPFVELARLERVFNMLVPKYESRESLIRESVPEVQSNLFMSCIASTILSTNLFVNAIKIEQNSDLKVLSIKAPHNTKNRKDFINLINFLCSIKIFNWHFLAIISDAKKEGILVSERDMEYVRYKIFYQNSNIRDFKNNTLEDRVLDYFKRKAKVTRGDIMFDLAISDRSASRALINLTKSGKIIRIGSKGAKNSFYTLVKQ